MMLAHRPERAFSGISLSIRRRSLSSPSPHLLRDLLDLGLRQRAVKRRKRDLDGERSCWPHALALEDVEDAHARNRPFSPLPPPSPQPTPHWPYRPKRRSRAEQADSRSQGTVLSLFPCGEARECNCREHLECGERTGDIESFQRLGMQLAEMAEHGLRAELQSPSGPGDPGPGRMRVICTVSAARPRASSTLRASALASKTSTAFAAPSQRRPPPVHFAEPVLAPPAALL